MTTTEKECALVASVLCAPHSKLGPNVCTALGFWQYWESPEASKLVEAIGKVISRGKAPSPAMVKPLLQPEYRAWLFHSMFTEYGALPVSCLESVAAELLPNYQKKRLVDTIASACERILQNPQKVKEVARELVLRLGGLV